MRRCCERLELHGLDSHSISKGHGTTQEYAEFYRHMALIRMMETHLDKEYMAGRVRGFCHLSIGQEGLYAVLMKLLEANNHSRIIASYRCHAAAYAAGCTIKEIVSENLGLKGGCSGGKGGSMHLYNERFYGGHGIVGAQVPLGTGVAFSIKYQKHMQDPRDWMEGSLDFVEKSKKHFIGCRSNGTCFTIYGDGAANQGQVYEAFNMAKIYNLPVVFVVENNRYGMYTPVENVSVDDCFYKRGYGIPGLRVCDTDIMLLRSALEFACDYSMKNGPIIVQVDTYRICGYSTEDKAQLYRTDEEQDNERQLDCLKTVEDLLGERMTKESLEKLKEDIMDEFQEAIRSIDMSKRPGTPDLYTDVYYD